MSKVDGATPPRANNAVVICADTFRADHIGAYGNDWIRTPNLNQLASQGITFQNAFAEALPTIPARKAYFTGRPLFPHWQRLPYKGDPLSRQPGWHPLHDHEVTFPEILRPHGFVTGLVADTYHLFKPGMNLARTFSSWQMVRGQEADPHRSGPRRDLPKLLEPYTGIAGLEQADLLRSSIPRGGGAVQYLLNNAARAREEDYLVARVMRTAAQWLEDNAPSSQSGPEADAPRFVLWIDCFDPHEPWDPPRADADLYDPDFRGPEPVFALHNRWEELSPQHQRRAKALYAGEVTFVDRWIGFLLDRVRQLGLDDSTAVFFTTDHGTILGEHNRLHKSPETLIAPETRLPLIVRLPGGAHAGARPTGLLQSYDLLPTLLDVLGVAQPDFVTGHSALPLIEDTARGRDHVVTAYTDHCSFRTPDWNLLSAYDLPSLRLTGAPRLFNLREDPRETTDSAADHPGIVRALTERLQEHLAAPPPPHPQLEEGR
jgi:arylsulfatase A-like enzyme